ncbi:prolipoprotein diacylglyceryl transferase [Patescibacteria group bacterium]|nr:prolipoprotein diacylglyceryl transferase [Patescibacteria group bacterium]
MYPYITLFGPFIVYAFWVFTYLAIIAGLYIFLKIAQKYRLDLHILTKHSILMIISTVIFARFARLIFIWKDIFGNSGSELINNLPSELSPGFFEKYFKFIYPFDQQYSVWGALFGALIFFIPYAIKHKQNVWRWLDSFTIPVLVGLAIGNIGLFMDGRRHFGTPSNLPWAINSLHSKFAVDIHPTQIYSFLYCLAIAGIIYYFFKRRNKYTFWDRSGNLALLGIALFSFIRFWQEFIIGIDKYLNIFGIYITYYISAAAFITATTYLIIRFNKFKQSKNDINKKSS